MQTYEIWATLSPALNHEILDAAYRHDKRLYRDVVREAGEVLRKRPQIILEMPRAERHELFRPLLGLPAFNVQDNNLAVNWLRCAGEPMMVLFLDTLAIPHDGHGCVDKFPPTPDEVRLARACAALYEKFPAEQVSFYLRLFPLLSDGAWQPEKFIPGDAEKI